uniref:Uncharacterized protein n=1 Tax=Aureoumbra lagunensis TaxID=44058 RepID=A0A7S3NLU7_9STRA
MIKEPKVSTCQRSVEDRRANPERLNLDRLKLQQIPELRNEQNLKLLNLQNNEIECLQYLDCVPNLIFLDFYHNKLQHLDGTQLEKIAQLRVFMLGKNRLKSIGNEIQKLQFLDVLDLHSNHLTSVASITNLKVLRVLNLAQNKLTEIDFKNLDSLTELNLRRNQIHTVHIQLPKLQRLFLAHNCLNSLAQLRSFWHLPLSELSLQDNPGLENYRNVLIAQIKSLRFLDLTRITPIERRESAVLNEPAQENDYLFDETQRKWLTEHSEINPEINPQYGYFQLQQRGKLYIFGPKFLHEINTNDHLIFLSLRFVTLSAAVVDRLKKLKKLKSAKFLQNNITTFPQLFSLLEALPNSLQDLEISLNPICELKLFPLAVLCHMNQLLSFNDATLSKQDFQTAQQKFQPILKQFYKSTASKKSFPATTNVLDTILSRALANEKKRAHFDRVLWPTALKNFYQDCVHEHNFLLQTYSPNQQQQEDNFLRNFPVWDM